MELPLILVLVSVPGFFGGFVSGLYEINKNPQGFTDISREDRYRFYFTRAMIGIAGAFGIFLFAMWMDKLCFEGTSENKMHIVSLCLVGGTIAFKALPGIGTILERNILQQVSAVEEKTVKVEEKAEKALEEQRFSTDYASAIADAQTALSKNDTIDVDHCITQLLNLKENHKPYKVDRRLNIYLARLYRKKKNYVEAIVVLRQFIDALDEQERNSDASEPHYVIDRADAYYNISCYHALMLAEAKELGKPSSEVDRLARETIEALTQSIEDMGGNPKNKAYAIEDDDFKSVRDLDEFKALVG